MSNRPEGTFEHLRYFLGGDRPSQTAHQALSSNRMTVKVRIPKYQGWYLNVGSTKADAPASKPPTYPARDIQKFKAKLQ